MACTNKMKIVYGDGGIGLHGAFEEKSFSYLFGGDGPHSMKINQREWLYKVPKPTFWRALTDNDRGNGFAFRSGMWLTADTFIRGRFTKIVVDGEKEIPLPIAPFNDSTTDHEEITKVKIVYVYQTLTVPSTDVKVTYIVKGDGSIKVKVHFYGKEGLPELPVLGMRFIMPTCVDSFTYEGLSGETYPDRMAGGIPGIYKVEGLPVTPYIQPQECGMHMNTQWVELSRSTSLRNDMKKAKTEKMHLDLEGLAFSCLPYTAEEIENATHQEELPAKRRTVLCVNGAVRGVGGIDSWGADVEEDFHVSAQKDYKFSFVIRP